MNPVRRADSPPCPESEVLYALTQLKEQKHPFTVNPFPSRYLIGSAQGTVSNGWQHHQQQVSTRSGHPACRVRSNRSSNGFTWNTRGAPRAVGHRAFFGTASSASVSSSDASIGRIIALRDIVPVQIRVVICVGHSRRPDVLPRIGE
eukprot:jgi/Mesvir1/6297/Mv03876-RA.1